MTTGLCVVLRSTEWYVKRARVVLLQAVSDILAVRCMDVLGNLNVSKNIVM